MFSFFSVENKNKELKKNISIPHILDLYQYDIIMRYKLPRSMHDMGYTKFFNQLFDELLKTADKTIINKNGNISLSVGEIDALICFTA